MLTSPSPDLIRGLTGRSSKQRPGILDCQSKSDASDFDHLVSAEVGQARLRVKPGNDTHGVNLTEKRLSLTACTLRRHLWRRSDGHESIECCRLGVGKHKPELGATPQHIGGGSGEFFPHQIAHLGFRQRCAESQAEIGRRTGARKDALRTLAIGNGKPAAVRWFKEWIVPRELLGKFAGLVSYASWQSRECCPAGAVPA